MTEYLNRVAKYVVSGTLRDPQWEPTTVLAPEELPDAIRALKAEPGRDIVTTGSITLVPSLRLVEARPFRSGVVLLRYRPAAG